MRKAFKFRFPRKGRQIGTPERVLLVGAEGAQQSELTISLAGLPRLR